VAKLTLNDITAGTKATTLINNNFALIEQAFENTLSRDGTTPNMMDAELDMNSNDINNVDDLRIQRLFIKGNEYSGVGQLPTLNQLLDVDVTSATEDQVLTYNAVTQTWGAEDGGGGLDLGVKLAEDGGLSSRFVVDPTNPDHDWYISRGIQRDSVAGAWELAVTGDSPSGIFFNGDSTQNGLVVVAAGNHQSLAAGTNIGRPEDFPAVLELSGSSGICRLSTNGTTRLTVNDSEVIVRDQLRMSATGAPILATASTTSGGSIRIPHGVAPTTPTDGDFWSTTAGFYGRVNGATVGPFTAGGVSISGTPVNNQLAVWTDANTVEGEADITYDQTTFTLANHVAMQLPSGYRIQFGTANYHINGQASKIQVAGTNFETEFDASIGSGGSGTSQLNVNANATGTSYLNFKQNSVIKGYLAYENTGAQMHLDSDGQIVISPNNTTALTLATSGAATFASSVTATNYQTDATKLVAGNFTFNIDQTVGAGQDNFVLVYDNASGEIGLEAAGVGGGDVVKVGTPVNNQLGVWTGDGTIEGDANLTFDGTTLTLGNGQLKFPATANVSADANTLDDYQEAEYVPTLTPTTGTITVGTTDTLAYTKIGRVVFIQGQLGVTAISSPTGAVVMSLPFNVVDLTDVAEQGGGAFVPRNLSSGSVPSNAVFYTSCIAGTSTCSLQIAQYSTNTGFNMSDYVAAGTAFHFDFFYFTNE
jgi:hypothetical protein